MKKYSGLMFIGDVHLSKSKPGRRLDDDFYSIAKGKLVEALDYALEHNLKPIMIGQLLKRVFEISVYSELINIFKDKDILVIASSNELKGGHRVANEHSSLNLLAKSGVITLSSEVELVEKVMINEFVVNLYSSPESMGYPMNFGIPEGVKESEKTVLLFKSTSEDFNSVEYQEEILSSKKYIPGCDLFVSNIYTEEDSYSMNGKTGWLDTGPLVRSKLDEVNVVPKFWIWSPEKDPTFEVPSHEKHVFDEEGLTDSKIKIKNENSEFSNLLKEQSDKAKNGELDTENFVENELSKIVKNKNFNHEICGILNEILAQTKEV